MELEPKNRIRIKGSGIILAIIITRKMIIIMRGEPSLMASGVTVLYI